MICLSLELLGRACVALFLFNIVLRKQYLESPKTAVGLVLSQIFNYLPVF